MDLTSNLGLDPEKVVLMHKTNQEFMAEVGLLEDKKWSRIATEEDRVLPEFTLDPIDKYTNSIITKLSDNLSLINVGLGSEDVLFEDRCAHGLSGPLKYYLALLNEKDAWVVIDSVAGTDMLNFGLYAGIDVVIGVVEPHRNSVKVFEQINVLCKKTRIPCFAIVNKPAENEFYDYIQENFGDIVLGEIPYDEKVLSYDYQALKDKTKEEMNKIISKLSLKSKRNGIESVREFQSIKNS